METTALITDKPDSASVIQGSPDRFGYSWDKYPKILPQHEHQFLCWTAPLKPEDWQGKKFLDAGCGIGRNSYWPMRYGAAGGVAIDVDDRTLRNARANLACYPCIEVRSQSIYDINDENEFDIVFSIGVVHHLEFPDIAVARLVQATKPMGCVLVWLYGRENNEWILKFADPIRKLVFSRLPLWLVHLLSWPLTIGLWTLLRLGLRQRKYFQLLSELSFSHLRAIIFDHMIPTISRYYSREEAIELLRRAGLKNIKAVWVNEMSWAVVGIKPNRV